MDNENFNLIKEIVSDLNEEVKNFKSFIPNNIPNKPNLPDLMKDHIFNSTPNKSLEYFDKQWKENPHITGINQAYAKLKEKAEVGSLDDSFRTTNHKELRSGTETSFKKTVRSFNRYYSILQESN